MAKEKNSMLKMVECNIEFKQPTTAASRGTIIQVTPPSGTKAELTRCKILVEFSGSWHTCTHITLNNECLHLIAVGHIYARDAATYNTADSLHLLGRAYNQTGMEAVRADIGGGIFALFIIDLEKRQLYAICDLLAFMPLFYSITNNIVTISTNQLDISESRQLSTSACLEYLSFGYLPFGCSIFEGIERLGPGQTLSVDFNTGQISGITAVQLPVYPVIDERIKDFPSACKELDRAFTRFFSRFDGQPISTGLSGGYDSRLIAAFTCEYSPYLVTFNYPGTREVDTALIVSNYLKNPTHLIEIPADAPKIFLEDFLSAMQSLENIGSSHVFVLLDALMHGNPSFIIDGFMGDVILGGGFYYKLTGGTEPLGRVITLRDKYNRRPQSIDTYVDMCLAGYGRAIDLREFLGVNNLDFMDRAKLESFVSQQLSCCHSHADMVELLLYRFRGRRAACGPISFLRSASTLCPYYDTDIFSICMATDKTLRSGDRLYNAFWRYRFPGLAGIPKESTGGSASQSDFGYRLTHFRNALVRRISSRIPASIISQRKPGGDLGDFETKYFKSPHNQKMFNTLFDHAWPYLSAAGLNGFAGLVSNPNLSKPLYLRLASLAALIADSEIATK